jgi:hypothetical protein
MRISIRGRVLLASAYMMAGVAVWGQKSIPTEHATSSLEVAITYDASRANLIAGDSFWMQGGGVQVHGQFWHGLGVVADVTGLHTANIDNSGIGLDLVTATFGPRYTWSPAHARYSVFGQALVGVAKGINSLFPGTPLPRSSADSLAVQLGGGVDLPLKRHIALRAFEADWIRTQMPNLTTGVQNNLKLGAGIVFRF